MRKRSATEKENSKNIGISEEEQLRIINETGILHKINRPAKRSAKFATLVGNDESSDLDENLESDENSDTSAEEPMPLWAEAVLIATPLTLLNLVFEYIIYFQYDFKNDFTFSRMVRRAFPIFMLLSLLVWGSNKIRPAWILHVVYAIASSATGAYLIELSSDPNKTFGTMLKTPGLAILWIFLVIEMNLTAAAASLIVPIAFYAKKFAK